MSVQNGVFTTPGDIASSYEPPSEMGERHMKLQHFGQPVPTAPQIRKRKVLVRKKKVTEESPLQIVCAWIVEHQLGLSLNLILLLSLTHLIFPRARPHTRVFLEMSYYNPVEKNYTQGWDDMYVVCFWIVALTGIRVAVMDYVLKPIARYGGIDSKKSQTRFAEQGWLCVYATFFWSLGMVGYIFPMAYISTGGCYLAYNSEYWFNLREVWNNFPTHTMRGLLKWYYLAQFAFWLQQLFVVNIEEKRKDHWQMFTHHIFTSALLFFSYGYYQTKIGNVILCLMDVVDILLPLAKMLNYLDLRTACDATFGIFITVWFFARHVAYLLVCRSMFTELPHVMHHGCFDSTTGKKVSDDGGSSIWKNVMQPFERPGEPVCFNDNIRIAFTGLLMALQVLTLLWFGMILRVAYGVICGKAAEDSRSDDEGEGDEIEEFEEYDEKIVAFDGVSEHATRHMDLPIEEEVDAESLNLGLRRKTSPGVGSANPTPRRSSRRTGTGRATALSIPGHGDRKELLGRIGCDKPS